MKDDTARRKTPFMCHIKKLLLTGGCLQANKRHRDVFKEGSVDP